MNRHANPVLLAELRDSAPAWGAVGLTFVATTFALVLSSMVMDSGLGALDDARGTDAEAWAVVAIGGTNLVLSVLVALAVIASATGLVVSSRRPAIARLALAGATPGQIVGLTVGQLVAVTLVASVVGSALAVAFLPTALELESKDRGVAAVDAVVRPVTIAVVALGSVVVAVLGGLRQARVASRVGPLEAAREATAGSSRLSVAATVLRWVGAVLLLGLVVAIIAGLPAVADALGEDAGSTVLQLSMAVLPLTGVALALAAPMFLAPLTHAWTRLLPAGAAWHLASRTVVARADRMVRSVVPMMFAVGLVLGMVTLGATFNATFRSSGSDVELSGVSTLSVLMILGLPLTIAATGAVGNLVMMTRAREAELAVSGLIGTTPAQRVAVTVLEALILTVTGILLAAVMTSATVVAMQVGLPEMFPDVTIVVPVVGALLVALVVGVAATLATTLPVLPSLRLPERAVVASHVAD